MLVLTRRQNQKFCFPNLGIEISVLRTADKAVKLGVEAPSNVRVLREELMQSDDVKELEKLISIKSSGMEKEERHRFRNHLNAVSLSLEVVQARIQNNDLEGIEPLLNQIYEHLRSIDSDLDNHKLAKVVKSKKVRPRALIVEDNLNEGQLLAELLKTQGYDAIVVENGIEAIEYLKKTAVPDIVLMDMNMPKMSGSETVHSIRNDLALRDLPLYAVSGMDSDDMGLEISDEGVKRWFTKPVDMRLLVKELNSEIADKNVSV